MKPALFIGLPVYNGTAHLRKALESVLAQKYEDWQLLVWDNNSTDGTVDLVEQYAHLDSRISIARHPNNIGAIANFVACARACPAEADYFAWFAHDDVWEPNFLDATVGRLKREPKAGFAWTNVQALDAYGQYQGTATDYSRYAGSGIWPAARFVLEHEVCGKAMLIYSVFRRSLVMAAVEAIPAGYVEASWDNVFNLACLSRAQLTVDRRHLFGKRAPRPTDAPGRYDPWTIRFDTTLGLSSKSWHAYFATMREAIRGTTHETLLTMLIRWRRYSRSYVIPRRALAASDISIA